MQLTLCTYFSHQFVDTRSLLRIVIVCILTMWDNRNKLLTICSAPDRRNSFSQTPSEQSCSLAQVVGKSQALDLIRCYWKASSCLKLNVILRSERNPPFYPAKHLANMLMLVKCYRLPSSCLCWLPWQLRDIKEVHKSLFCVNFCLLLQRWEMKALYSCLKIVGDVGI